MDSLVNLAGVLLEHPVMNAAGYVKTFEEVGLLARSPVSAIVLGSITLEARRGNTGTTVYAGNGFYINSLGLPNPGAEYYQKHLPEMVRMAHDVGKPLMVSVAGFRPEDYVQLVELCLETGVDIIILNFGCPNIWDEGAQKRIVSLHPDLVGVNLERVQSEVGVDAHVGVKVSPILDPYQLTETANVISTMPLVKFIVACNTIPNGFAFNDEGHPAIDPAGGLGGLSGGPLMKRLVMGQIIQWRNALPGMQIVAAGGVETGHDVMDYLNPRVGAVAVKVGAALHREGIDAITRIVTEYALLVED